MPPNPRDRESANPLGDNGIYFVGDDWNQRVAKTKFAGMSKFGKPAKGHISLQDHGNPVEFRNIKIRAIDVK